MKQTEIEFKWEANVPRAFWRMRRALQKTKVQMAPTQICQITDTYFDNSFNDFERNQMALRLRCCNQHWEATLKSRTKIINGKAVRSEDTWDLPKVKNLKQSLDVLRHKKSWEGCDIQNVHPLFMLKNHREIQQIKSKNWQAEISFDNCEILVCGRRIFLKEIELEFKKGDIASFEQYARQLTRNSGLNKARVSKVKTACSLLKLWGEK